MTFFAVHLFDSRDPSIYLFIFLLIRGTIFKGYHLLQPTMLCHNSPPRQRNSSAPNHFLSNHRLLWVKKKTQTSFSPTFNLFSSQSCTLLELYVYVMKKDSIKIDSVNPKMIILCSFKLSNTLKEVVDGSQLFCSSST